MKNIMNQRWLQVCTVTILFVFATRVSQSRAAPIFPHLHDQGKIQYPNPLPANFAPHSGGPNDANHSHVGGIAVKEVTPSAFGGAGPHMVDNQATPAWNTYSTWHNRHYLNGDTAAIAAYGHGFIVPTAATMPRYAFLAGVTGLPAADFANVKARVTEAASSWDAAAKAQGQNSRTTPDSTPLRTSLPFRAQVAGDGGASDLTVNFTPMPVGAIGGWSPGGKTLNFATIPQTRVRVNDPANPRSASPDWQVSSDGRPLNDGAKVFAALTPGIAVPWNFTTNAPAALLQDIDYLCIKAVGCGIGAPFGMQFEGNEAVFTTLGIQVSDGFAIAAATPAPLTQADFFTVLLHEWGHTIGLDHSPLVTDILFAQTAFGLGVANHTINLNNARAAAVLYSIPVPVPEPSTLTLFGLGTLVLLGYGWRRRKRAA